MSPSSSKPVELRRHPLFPGIMLPQQAVAGLQGDTADAGPSPAGYGQVVGHGRRDQRAQRGNGASRKFSWIRKSRKQFQLNRPLCVSRQLEGPDWLNPAEPKPLKLVAVAQS